MYAITIHRPYPFAILHLPKETRKTVENRGWKPPLKLVGERLAVHAGKTMSDDGLDAIEFHVGPAFDPRVDHMGIVGTVVVRGWLVTERTEHDYIAEVGHVQAGYERWAQRQCDSEWFTGPYGWLLDDPRPLAMPIACRGAQGLWRVPADVVAQIERLEQPATARVRMVSIEAEAETGAQVVDLFEALKNSLGSNRQ